MKTAKIVLINLLVFVLLDILLGVFLPKLFSGGTKKPANAEKDFRIPHNVFHHALRENFSGSSTWGPFKYGMNTDNFGFKSVQGKTTAKEKKGKRTIWIVDSFTEGIGLNYEQSFVGKFSSKYPNHEMINMGVVSYSPELYKKKLKYFDSAGLQYDQVVVCLDISDIEDELIYAGGRNIVLDFNESAMQRFIFRIKETIKSMSQYSITSRMLYTALYDSKFSPNLERTYYNQRGEWIKSDKIFNKWGKDGLTIATKNMVEIADFCKMRNKPLFLVIYPWPQYVGKPESYKRYTDHWQQFCSSHHVNFINLFDAFQTESAKLGNQNCLEKYYFKDDVHFNEAGNEFLFNAMDSTLNTFFK